MGLHRRLHTESLERRLCLAIESATPSLYLDADTDLVSQSAAVASGSDGGSVNVYSDRNSGTGKGNDVWLRRYFANGAPNGAAARVNTTLAGAQMNVDVAMVDFENYAVVWQSENQDGSGWGIYARIHNDSGWTAEVRVNQTTAGDQVTPKIAMTTGGAIVTWLARDENNGNGEIYARRITLAGQTPDNELKLTTGGNFAVSAPDVAAGSGVSFAWVSSDLADAGQTDVRYREYDGTLQNAQGTTRTVNTITAGDQAEPALAAMPGTSDTLVVFSDTSAGGDASISFRRMNAGLGPATVYPQRFANQDSDGNRNRPQVAASNTTVVIGWTQQIAGAPVASSVTRVYDSSLNAASNENFIDDGESARTLHGLAVVGNGRFREVTTLGALPGFGVASADDLANVILLSGTSTADQVVLYDSGSTIRASVNKQVTSYNRAAFDHIRIDLGAGNDTVIANDASLWATISGGDGNDTITATRGNDSIAGGNGNDVIDCGPGSDYAIGNDGHDRILGDAGNDTLTGGAGKDSLYGGDGNDRLAGSASPDQLFGETGDDRLYGEAGDDRLDGGGNVDRCYGGDGNDYVGGGSSNDRCFGEAGNDTLIGGKGSDYLDGGLNTDLVLSKEPGDTLISIESS